MHSRSDRVGRTMPVIAASAVFLFCVGVCSADPFFFSTGTPDGLIGTLSRPAGAAGIQTETADDFVLTRATTITQATFFGLLPVGSPLANITNIEIEFYRVFPVDSTNPPSGNVPTRVNSPSDVEIDDATREFAAGTLSFGASVVSPFFTVLNTVVNGINKIPNQSTGGEGPFTGEEVLITVTFVSPVDLAPDHYFFRPEVDLSSGNFLWLSAPKPIGVSGDLQSWIRNDNLAPDWLRIGTDITHQGPFNAAFSLAGTTPEPGSVILLGVALIAMWWARSRKLVARDAAQRFASELRLG